ncbi:uncharacterized protein BP5553_00636 [Venustampulla echinocandica]|uniref:Apple domain-containing protein n=1 Tax=Venustampulla echinocandica TaxID=2656787 RepID=A0A370TYQ2_9HELO|nr:uncharacterized protein BP5553_00636 [Venustampulla echinocandica]RDL40657.1 hypothetical protein BP5553_00636 [Venustampulla echinocandica]
MGLLFIFTLLLGAELSIASPHPMVTPSPILKRDDTWSMSASLCELNYVVTAISKMEHPPATYGPLNYTSWCSNLLRPYTVYATYTTLSKTSTHIISTAKVITTTDGLSRTSTLLCPTPLASPPPSRLCGVWAVMNRKYSETAFLNRVTDIPNAETCMQKCLADSKCKSFLYVNTPSGTGCTFYSLPVADGVDDLLTTGSYYDRGCPELLPHDCLTTPPRPTKGPALAKRDDYFPVEEIPYLGNEIDVWIGYVGNKSRSTDDDTNHGDKNGDYDELFAFDD